MTRSSTLAIAVCAAIVVTAAPARTSTTARGCLPLGGLLVAKTIRDRNEVTERLGHGAYRVTRCHDDGSLRISMTVARVADPDGGFVLAPDVIVRSDRVDVRDYGDALDPRWAKVWRRVRDRVRDTIIPATQGQPSTDAAFRPRSAASAGSECNDGEYIKTGSRWADKKYAWRWHSKSFGGNKDSLTSMKKAHTAWDSSNTNCDLSDTVNLKTTYEGTTSTHVQRDGKNVVDKGSMKAVDCQGALACTQVWYGANGKAIETDVRFSDSVKWSNSGASGAYDYRSIGTHEFGHALGLADLYDSPKLTMSWQVQAGDTANRTLGRGDIKGLRAIYD